MAHALLVVIRAMEKSFVLVPCLLRALMPLEDVDQQARQSLRAPTRFETQNALQAHMNWSPGLERNDLHFKAVAGALLAVTPTCPRGLRAAFLDSEGLVKAKLWR